MYIREYTTRTDNYKRRTEETTQIKARKNKQETKQEETTSEKMCVCDDERVKQNMIVSTKWIHNLHTFDIYT